jgi:aminoglycoside phosphotransferase (APT) family kinase protein
VSVLATDRDAERIETALAVAGETARGDWTLKQLAGGWSRHTYVLAQGGRPRYVVRVKPPGALLQTSLVGEYRTYAALEGLPIPAPRVFGVEEAEETAFGGPFFVQEWLPGEGPNVWRRRAQDELAANWHGTRAIAEQFLDALVAIHAADHERFAHLGPVQEFGDVVDRWRATYEQMRLVEDPIVDEAYAWLRGRTPPDPHVGLVHGDYTIRNTLIDGERITAVVDWELAYRGDTRFDLGYVSLEYLAGKFVSPGSPLASATAERSWIYEEYERRTGRALDLQVVRTYSALGALMLVAILCTGIRMHAAGETDDIRMAWNRYAVPGLRQELTRLMEW